jgi:hypothetical protein
LSFSRLNLSLSFIISIVPIDSFIRE